MPELPDLQAFSANLTKKFANKKVKQITVFKDNKLNIPKERLSEALEGLELISIEREGKELHFKFTDGKTLGLHLMLKGQLHYLKDSKDVKSKIIQIAFDDGNGIILSDFMAQAAPTFNPVVSEVPDALSEKFNFDYVKKKFSKEGKGTVKSLLLDQKFVRGIGNAYADEILYDCKISPFSICNKLPDEAIDSIIKSTKRVLLDSIEQIRKINPDIISGEVRSFFKVHISNTPETSTGEKINFKELGGKKTYYTDNQVLYS